MIVHIDSWIASLWIKLPNWFGYIESVRVGDDLCSFVRIGFFR